MNSKQNIKFGGGVFYVGSKMNSKKNINFEGGGLLHWIKNELIWNLGGGSFTLDQK